MTSQPPMPIGLCWCGCRKRTGANSFFVRGHDKAAEAALLALRYDNSIAHLLRHHGFGPGNSVCVAAVRHGHWELCPTGDCDYAGTAASVRNHQAKAGH